MQAFPANGHNLLEGRAGGGGGGTGVGGRLSLEMARREVMDEEREEGTWPSCPPKVAEQIHKLHTVMRGFVMRGSV